LTYGCGGSADLAIGYHIFAAKAAYCRRHAASTTTTGMPRCIPPQFNKNPTIAQLIDIQQYNTYTYTFIGE
jgi:hypothetical protein